MITFILFLILLIVGIVLVKLLEDNSILLFIGLTFSAIGVAGTFICVTLIFTAHFGIDPRISENEIQYGSLCKRLEIVNSDYEDVSKSDVIKDVAEWNTNVINERYWTYNPWTNWFYSKKVTDSLKYIELEE